jgi:starch-binding outer membrane protein, SusD/RagB family
MKYISFYTLFILLSTACDNYVKVDSLTDQLLANQVFSSDASSNSAIAGIYRNLRDKVYNAGYYTPAILTGLSGDELYNFFPDFNLDDYHNNLIQPTNSSIPWPNYYSVIYAANAAIEGLNQTTTVSSISKSQFTGEAKFIRAFCLFNLVNLFGEVPLVTSTNVTINSTAVRTSVSDIYKQIVLDLADAQNTLPTDYSISLGEHIRANKWVATAMLSKVYLYLEDWPNAEIQASSVINSGAYSLLTDIDSIAIENNAEAIFQYANNTTDINTEPQSFIFTSSPVLVCTSSLLNSFEPGDQRRLKWIDSGTYAGITYYYPYKYKLLIPGNEYFNILRLAEQYLIRAEARAGQNNLDGAISDLNTIRLRAGLLPINNSISKDSCLAAIQQERRVELFAEEANRWYDLKRLGKIDSTLLVEKPGFWKPTASLYPIPLSDINKDNNLTQNPGYQ